MRSPCSHIHCCGGLRLTRDGLLAVLVCDDCCQGAEFLHVLPGITADVREKSGDGPAYSAAAERVAVGAVAA
jgi:hypothetical protein